MGRTCPQGSRRSRARRLHAPCHQVIDSYIGTKFIYTTMETTMTATSSIGILIPVHSSLFKSTGSTGSTGSLLGRPKRLRRLKTDPPPLSVYAFKRPFKRFKPFNQTASKRIYSGSQYSRWAPNIAVAQRIWLPGASIMEDYYVPSRSPQPGV